MLIYHLLPIRVSATQVQRGHVVGIHYLNNDTKYCVPSLTEAKSLVGTGMQVSDLSRTIVHADLDRGYLYTGMIYDFGANSSRTTRSSLMIRPIIKPGISHFFPAPTLNYPYM